MKKIKVAMVAPPWIKIPPDGYGGIEQVLHALVPELRKQGAHVELFATGDSTTPNDGLHAIYPETGQFEHIYKPLYESSPIVIAQVLFALNVIKQAGDFDIIHDHTGFVGNAALTHLNPAHFPPVVSTLHGPPFSNPQMLSHGWPDNRPMYKELGGAERFYVIPISEALVGNAPRELKPIILPAVHNAIELKEFKFKAKKEEYFITLARFSQEKGQHLAVKLCTQLGYKLKMAGIVAGISTPRQLLLELANPLSPYRHNPDFKYYSDEIWPHVVDNNLVKYIGNVSGERKIEFIGNAKAMLFPIDWDEPFGMAPIEALACGTPVVAMRRGALPEIIEHGVNGFLADDEAEFQAYMQQVDDIDPAECRRSVERKFSAPTMASGYIERYREVIAKHSK